MSVIIEIVLILALVTALLVKRAPGWIWAVSAGAYLAAWPAWHTITGWVLAPVALILAAANALLAIPPLRRNLISMPVMRLYRKIMPTVSQTEREALEAGTLWWEAELFSGAPDWQKLLDYPQADLTEEEQAFLDGPVETLCAMLDDWEITQHHHDLPEPIWGFIKSQGFFGMIIPKRYGGLEFSAYAHSCVVMKVASRSISAGGDGDGAQLAGTGEAAAALRHRGPEGPLSAATGQRARKSPASR